MFSYFIVLFESYFNILWANECSIGNLGSGSDYTVFSHVLGVPCVDLYYDYQEVIFCGQYDK